MDQRLSPIATMLMLSIIRPPILRQSTLVQTPYTGLGLSSLRDGTTPFLVVHAIFGNRIVNELREAGSIEEKLKRHSNTALGGFLSSIGFDQSDIDAYGAVVGESELATLGHPQLRSAEIRNFSEWRTKHGSPYGSEPGHLRRYVLTWVLALSQSPRWAPISSVTRPLMASRGQSRQSEAR